MRKRVIGMMVLAAAVVGGCSTGVNRAELRKMPADLAWQDMKDKASEAGTASAVAGYVGLGPQAKEYKAALDADIAKAEASAQRADTPEAALREMVKDVSSHLMATLPTHAKSRGIAEHRLNLGMGKLVNRDADPTLDQALALIRNDLAADQTFTNQFRILSSDQSRADAILRDLASSNPDGLFNPTGAGSTKSADYRPDTLYIVEGETWIRRERDRNELTVTTNITASHPQSREMFSSKVFARRYFYHPGDQAFITEAENEARRASWNAAKTK